MVDKCSLFKTSKRCVQTVECNNKYSQYLCFYFMWILRFILIFSTNKHYIGEVK